MSSGAAARADLAGADVIVPCDGRQSPRALAIQRGSCRLLRALGFAAVTELALSSGHRADIAALGPKGEIWIVEIKSGIEDLRADRKWPAYLEHCDRLFFAVGDNLPLDMLPEQSGIMVADRFGAAIVREAPQARLAAARRKAMHIRFARAAALRLHALMDPQADATGA